MWSFSVLSLTCNTHVRLKMNLLAVINADTTKPIDHICVPFIEVGLFNLGIEGFRFRTGQGVGRCGVLG